MSLVRNYIHIFRTAVREGGEIDRKRERKKTDTLNKKMSFESKSAFMCAKFSENGIDYIERLCVCVYIRY